VAQTGEVVHFADIVAKVNKRNKMQDRVLIITDQAIYNIDPSSFKVSSLSPFPFPPILIPSDPTTILQVKRRIQLQDLEGMR
jgi:hypothetical protein